MSNEQAVSQEPEALAAPELRLLALQSMLIEKGHVEPPAIAALIKAFGNRIDPGVDTDLTPPAAGLPPAQIGAQAMLAIPKNADGPLFRQQWEALAFGLALALAERGAFTWAEWAATFGEEISRATNDDEGPRATYYLCWLSALEQTAARKGLAERVTSP